MHFFIHQFSVNLQIKQKQHIMNKLLLTLIALVTVIFSSCNLESESNFTPTIRFTKPPVVINKADTINIKLINPGDKPYTVLCLDTISVGDTVSFGVLFNGFVNNITSFSMTQSADSISRILLPRKSSLDSVFTTSSNYSQGVFNLSKKTVSVYMPFRYVARKASLTSGIKFNVVSDANFSANYFTVELITPIKEKLGQE